MVTAVAGAVANEAVRQMREVSVAFGLWGSWGFDFE